MSVRRVGHAGHPEETTDLLHPLDQRAVTVSSRDRGGFDDLVLEVVADALLELGLQQEQSHPLSGSQNVPSVDVLAEPRSRFVQYPILFLDARDRREAVHRGVDPSVRVDHDVGCTAGRGGEGGPRGLTSHRAQVPRMDLTVGVVEEWVFDRSAEPLHCLAPAPGRVQQCAHVAQQRSTSLPIVGQVNTGPGQFDRSFDVAGPGEHAGITGDEVGPVHRLAEQRPLAFGQSRRFTDDSEVGEESRAGDPEFGGERPRAMVVSALRKFFEQFGGGGWVFPLERPQRHQGRFEPFIDIADIDELHRSVLEERRESVSEVTGCRADIDLGTRRYLVADQQREDVVFGAVVDLPLDAELVGSIVEECGVRVVDLRGEHERRARWIDDDVQLERSLEHAVLERDHRRQRDAIRRSFDVDRPDRDRAQGRIEPCDVPIFVHVASPASATGRESTLSLLRYPFLPPIGARSLEADESWRLAGTDVATALELAARDAASSKGNPAGLVRTAEIARRAGAFTTARAAIVTASDLAGDDPIVRALVALAEGYLDWWTPSAADRYAEVERIGRELADPVCTGLGILGRLRCSRFRLDGVPEGLFDEAASLLAGDQWASADLDRERAAHHLLADRADLARKCAERALQVHRDIGDDVLGAYAMLLLGRVERDTAPDRFRLLREAYGQATRAGAHDVAADVALFLIPALARGQSPGSALLREARSIADHVAAYKRENDPFGAAELDTQLAGMLTLSDPSAAMAHAERSSAYFDSIGNELGVASATKAMARIELRRMRIVWQGSWLRGVRSSPVGLRRVMALYAKAKRSYRAAGMETAAQRVSIEQSLIRTYQLGAPLPQDAVVGLGHGLPRKDQFTDAKLAVLDGLAVMHDDPALARRSFERAAVLSSAVGMSDLESVAQVGIAATSRRLGEPARAANAVERFIDHAEHLRVSVDHPAVALDMVQIADEPYRYALGVAAETGEALLALRILERIRTERLASLFATRTRRSPRPDVEAVIDRLTGQEPGVEREKLLEDLVSLTNTYFGEFYAPSTLTIDELVAHLPAGEHVLVQELSLQDGSTPELVSVWRLADSKWQVERRTLAVETTELLDRLAAGGASRRSLVLDDLGPLAQLIPGELGEHLVRSEHGRLRVIPSGLLWAVPYLVVPVTEGSRARLVETADVAITPSLRLLAAARRRDRELVGGPVVSWLSPELSNQRGELAPFDDRGLVEARTPSEFLDVLARRSDLSMAIITSHCNDDPGLAQSATLAGRPVITAADLLGVGRVPPIVSIAGCHGLSAARSGDEQLGLTTAALCGGADIVVSSHLELSTSVSTTMTMLRVYRQLVEGVAPDVAVSSVVRRLVQEADPMRTRLVEWGALNVVSVRA